MPVPLRIATIGAGYFSQFHHDAWSRMPDVRLVAVCDLDQDRAREFARRYGAENSYRDAATMLDIEKPDLIDIVTPPEAHLSLIGLAAERGIDAICQKAFCSNLEEARLAAEIGEKSGIRLVVHENFRFQPWYDEIKSMIDRGDLGEIYQTTFRLRPGDGQGPLAYLDRQPYFQTMRRFLVHETAIHFVDLFRFLLGDYRSVFADLRRLNPVIAGEDAGLIFFEHKNGARSLFDGNRLVDHPAKSQRLTMGEMLVEGSKAVIHLNGDGKLFRRRLGEAGESEIHFHWDNDGFGGGAVLRLQRHVVDGIRNDRAIMNSARDYVRCLEVESAIYRSAETGTVQRL